MDHDHSALIAERNANHGPHGVADHRGQHSNSRKNLEKHWAKKRLRKEQ
jgi:hypothetical protein